MDELASYRYLMVMEKPYRFASTVMILGVLSALFISCSVEQNIVLQTDLSGRWTSNGRAESFATDTFDDLALLGGYDSAAELYGRAVNDARVDLERREGVESADVKLIGAHSWRADIQFTDLENLLGAAEGSGIVEITQSDNVATLHFRVDRSRAKNIEKLIPMLADPALSLFNPASTTNVTEERYLNDVLGFTFGKDKLPSIRRSKVSLDISLPGEIQEIRGGRRTGPKSVHFEDALTRFLVPERGIDWMVSWSIAE